MRELQYDLEVTDNRQAILVVECPECGDKSRFLLDEVSPGTSVLCNCGEVLSLTDDGIQSVKQKLADTQNAQD